MISDKGVESIARSCPNLKVFSVHWNMRVTATGVMHLVKHCKHITDLNLSGRKAETFSRGVVTMLCGASSSSSTDLSKSERTQVDRYYVNFPGVEFDWGVQEFPQG